jgi:hypothetical protein
MSQVVRQILKAAEVSLDSPVRMSLDPAAMKDCGVSPSSAAASGVRIVQSQPGHVVIEVTCPCGRTTQVRCDYAQTQ